MPCSYDTQHNFQSMDSDDPSLKYKFHRQNNDELSQASNFYKPCRIMFCQQVPSIVSKLKISYSKLLILKELALVSSKMLIHMKP